MSTKQTEALELALKRAFNLGQTYWQQADSEYTSQWKKADVTLASFNQLLEDTIREALAEQPAQQQEPVQKGKWVGTVVDSGKGYKVIGFGVDALADVPIGTRCYAYPQPSKPLTDEQINEFFQGMEPNNGFWLSFARAIEAAHGITGEQK